VLFKLRHLFSGTGLRDVKFFRSFSEAAQLDNALENPNAAEMIHRIIIERNAVRSERH
jgi:hypothetical protein